MKRFSEVVNAIWLYASKNFSFNESVWKIMRDYANVKLNTIGLGMLHLLKIYMGKFIFTNLALPVVLAKTNYANLFVNLPVLEERVEGAIKFLPLCLSSGKINAWKNQVAELYYDTKVGTYVVLNKET